MVRPRSGPSSGVRLTVVGSGTMVPDPERVSASVWIETEASRLLVDVGWGSLHRMEALGLPWRRVDRILLTHFHGDHTGNLPALMAVLNHGLDEPRDAPLEIVGGAGLRSRLIDMAGAYGGFMTDPAFPLDVTELAPGDTLSLADLLLECGAANHRPESLAYRLTDPEGRSLAVTGDTGPSQELAHFVRGVQLLVTECAFPDPPADDGHLSPAGVARILDVAEPRLTLLTHTYPQHDPAALARAVAGAGYEGRVEAAEDGTAVELSDGEPVAERPRGSG